MLLPCSNFRAFGYDLDEPNSGDMKASTESQHMRKLASSNGISWHQNAQKQILTVAPYH